jgi:hypothetical protein
MECFPISIFSWTHTTSGTWLWWVKKVEDSPFCFWMNYLLSLLLYFSVLMCMSRVHVLFGSFIFLFPCFVWRIEKEKEEKLVNVNVEKEKEEKRALTCKIAWLFLDLTCCVLTFWFIRIRIIHRIKILRGHIHIALHCACKLYSIMNEWKPCEYIVYR